MAKKSEKMGLDHNRLITEKMIIVLAVEQNAGQFFENQAKIIALKSGRSKIQNLMNSS